MFNNKIIISIDFYTAALFLYRFYFDSIKILREISDNNEENISHLYNYR